MSNLNKCFGLLVVVSIASLFLIASANREDPVLETVATYYSTRTGTATFFRPSTTTPSLTLEPQGMVPDAGYVNDLGLTLNGIFETDYGNYYFSPISVYTVLNIIAISSVGDTRQELDDFTGINNSALIIQPEHFFSTIALWYSDTLLVNDNFIKPLNISNYKYSGVGIEELQSWVYERTGQQQRVAQRSLFAPESEISFAFVNQFSLGEYLPDGGGSLSGKFTLMDETNMRIDYYCTFSPVSIVTTKKYRFFSMPAIDPGKRLVILQPFNKYDVMNMVSSIKYEDLVLGEGDGLMRHSICIPQGNYFSENDFADPLIAYGIRRIFFPDVAELSNLSNSPSVFISGIYSYAEANFIIRGETISYSSLQKDTLWLDSPFLYFEIDDRTSMILGIGRFLFPN